MAVLEEGRTIKGFWYRREAMYVVGHREEEIKHFLFIIFWVRIFWEISRENVNW
jgi:hypothetical protein